MIQLLEAVIQLLGCLVILLKIVKSFPSIIPFLLDFIFIFSVFREKREVEPVLLRVSFRPSFDFRAQLHVDNRLRTRIPNILFRSDGSTWQRIWRAIKALFRR